MPTSAPSLVVEDLRKDFGPVAALDGRRVRVLHGINLQARPGAVTTILGANGAGKSTTLACAQGLLHPDAGSVRLLGADPASASSSLRSRVGVMLQDGGLPQSATPRQLLRHVAGMYERPADLAALCARLGIDEFAHTTIRRLSGGQRQRVALAAALAGRPEVLFLDEPSAGLDPQSRRTVFALIEELRGQGLAIVLTTHLMEDAQRLSDYVYIIAAGRNVAEGTVDELTARTAAGEATRALSFTAAPGLALDAARLPAGVRLTEESPGHYRATGIAGPAALTALARWWEEHGVLPSGISMEPRSLEDVFLEIAQNGAADD
ncbi:ABC transporter ATP-binding protein [Zafaria sp. Z1313]|uniref:ABC transporter ATP-binding protein n=1 Tax=Zafaria sp. Z1313 TaxID=3423202 RepID=UPI003D302E0F